MKIFNEIIFVIIGLLFLYFVLFIPIQGNYNINNVDEQKGLMDITYTSIIPLTKVDTIVKMPTYLYGQVIYNYYENTKNGTTYKTAVKVNNEIYTYNNINAYHYVKEFTIGKDSIKLMEIYWPSHYIKTIPFKDIYGEK